MKRILLILLALLTCTVLLTACFGEEGDGGDDGIVVTYYVYEGETALLREVPVVNGRISFEKLPTRTGYRFLGLFDAQEGGVMYLDPNGITTIEITASVMLYSRWEAEEYKICFDAGEGSLPSASAVLRAPYGSDVTEFPVPVYEGYAFVGWCDEGGKLYSDVGTVLEERIRVTADAYAFEGKSVTLYAVYDQRNPNVTLTWGDGSGREETFSVPYGETIPADRLPTEDTGSSELIGWTDTVCGTTPFAGAVRNDMTLYPIWKEYRTVIFNDMLGGRNEVKLYRDTVIDLETYGDLDRPGYTVEGWYVNASFSGNPLTTLGYGTAAEELFARWESATYTLTFDAESAGESFPPVTYHYGDSASLPVPERVGYRFLGWFTDAECKGTPMTAITVTTYGSYTLYAGFEQTVYCITLNTAGGTLPNYVVELHYGDAFVLDVPARPGYTFLGWYTAAEDGELFANAAGVPTSATYTRTDNLLLYAAWETATYTLTFDSVSAGESIPSVTYQLGEEKALPSLSRPGYRFLGWFTDAACQGIPMTEINSTTYGSYTLYAGFERIVYRINLKAEGGALGADVKELYYGDTFTLEVPTRTGYTFLGWYTAAGEEGLLFADMTGKPLQSYFAQQENLNIYAHWQPNRYTVRFETNGGSTVAPVTHDHNQLLQLPAEPQNGELIFAGWYDKDLAVAYDANVRVTSDLTLYAKWIRSTPISNASELYAIAQDPTANYHLVKDVNLGGAEWTSVPGYSGLFNGKGFRIHNFTLSSDAESCGFFGKNSGTVIDLTLADFVVNATGDFTYAGVLCGVNTGTVRSCKLLEGVLDGRVPISIADDVADGTVLASYIGGIAGKNEGEILSCEAEMTLRRTMSSDYNEYSDVEIQTYAGLLAGISSGTVDGCRASGALLLSFTKGRTSYLSGWFIAGGAIGKNSGKVTGSKSTATITASVPEYLSMRTYAELGGFVGENEGSISACAASAGTVGFADNNHKTVYVGGFVGDNEKTVANCYANMTLDVNTYYSSASAAGGFAGLNSGSILSSYAAGSVSAGTAYDSYDEGFLGGFVGRNQEAGSLNKCLSATNLHVGVAFDGYGFLCGGGDTGNLVYKSYYGTDAKITNLSGDTEKKPTYEAGEAIDPAKFSEESFIHTTLSWEREIWTVEDGSTFPKLFFEVEDGFTVDTEEVPNPDLPG